MPFALLTIGLVLTVAAVNGHESDLFTLVKGDFGGPNNFVYWFIAIMVIGSLGYIEKFRPLSHMFLALVLVGLLLHKQGFFNQFQSAIAGTTNTSTAVAATAAGIATGAVLPTISPLEVLSGLSGVI